MHGISSMENLLLLISKIDVILKVNFERLINDMINKKWKVETLYLCNIKFENKLDISVWIAIACLCVKKVVVEGGPSVSFSLSTSSINPSYDTWW